jgi:hypothetical protein
LQLGQRRDAHEHGMADGVVAIQQVLKPVVHTLEQRRPG